MAITRQDLEADRLRTTLCSSPVASSLLSDADVERSLHQTLSQRPEQPGLDGDVWVFGYGSLIWNPMIVHTESRLATVHGYHRGFYLYSKINRGTWDHPGLVLGLDRGGCCTGMIFRVPAHVVEQEFRVLWRREMMTGAYHPRWLRVKLDTNPEAPAQRALAFVMNREHASYAGRLPDARVVACLQHACGLYGPARDYLHQTLLGLATHGVEDPYLGRLWRQLQASDAAEAAADSCPVATPLAVSASAATCPGDAIAASTHPHETV